MRLTCRNIFPFYMMNAFLAIGKCHSTNMYCSTAMCQDWKGCMDKYPRMNCCPRRMYTVKRIYSFLIIQGHLWLRHEVPKEYLWCRCCTLFRQYGQGAECAWAPAEVWQRSLDSKLKVPNINITDQRPWEFLLRRNPFVLFPVVNKCLLNCGEEAHNKMC